MNAEQAQLSLQIIQLEGKLFHKERQLESAYEADERRIRRVTLFPKRWEELIDSARGSLAHVRLPVNYDSRLTETPFVESIAKEVYELLQILEVLGEESGLDGKLTASGLEVHQQKFVGGNAWFSDESSTNKRDFEKELTFKHPTKPERRLFCPWHGKINQQQFRIHFEWPRPEGQREVNVVYIGPKLTKH